MQLLKNKLASERGVSMLVALLFFLVAFMVTVVILDASVTTVKRLSDERDQEQNYLTVTSAARLIRQCLEESTCTITETKVTKTNHDSGDEVSNTASVTYSSTGAYGSVLEKIVRAAYEDPFASDPTTYKSGDNVLRVHIDDPNLSDGVLTFTLEAEDENDNVIHFAYKLSGIIGTDDDQNDQIMYLSTHLKGNFGEKTTKTETVSEGDDTFTQTTEERSAKLEFANGISLSTKDEQS